MLVMKILLVILLFIILAIFLYAAYEPQKEKSPR